MKPCDCKNSSLTHPHPGRRDVLRMMAGGATALAATAVSPIAFAAETKDEGDFFIFIHASGGWDVTLWADPRNEKRGIIMPASTENTDPAGVKRWVDAPLEEGIRTFTPVRPSGSNLVFGRLPRRPNAW